MLLFGTGCFQEAPDPSGKNALAQREVEPLPCFTPDDGQRMAAELVELINIERVAADLEPITLNPALMRVASDYACTMIADQFFAHRDPYSGNGPGARAIAGGYMFYAVGENLAAGQQSPEDVTRLWMESPLHRANILDPNWKEAGVAVRFGGEFGVYWVLEFGEPFKSQLARR